MIILKIQLYVDNIIIYPLDWIAPTLRWPLDRFVVSVAYSWFLSEDEVSENNLA